jgi:hypothetical protein
MDYVACKIALGGDSNNVIYRGPDAPVSWPEIRVLQHLHGEDNVFDCEYVGEEPATTQAEKMRLLGIYGSEATNICFPGSRPMMDMQWPGDRAEPIATKRPERKLIADIQKSEPEPEPELELQAPLPPLQPLAAERVGAPKRSHHRQSAEV